MLRIKTEVIDLFAFGETNFFEEGEKHQGYVRPLFSIENKNNISSINLGVYNKEANFCCTSFISKLKKSNRLNSTSGRPISCRLYTHRNQWNIGDLSHTKKLDKEELDIMDIFYNNFKMELFTQNCFSTTEFELCSEFEMPISILESDFRYNNEEAPYTNYYEVPQKNNIFMYNLRNNLLECLQKNIENGSAISNLLIEKSVCMEANKKLFEFEKNKKTKSGIYKNHKAFVNTKIQKGNSFLPLYKHSGHNGYKSKAFSISENSISVKSIRQWLNNYIGRESTEIRKTETYFTNKTTNGFYNKLKVII